MTIGEIRQCDICGDEVAEGELHELLFRTGQPGRPRKLLVCAECAVDPKEDDDFVEPAPPAFEPIVDTPARNVIPYESVLDQDERNMAGAFFRVMPVDRDGAVGGLLVIDARGEPVEFSYTRVNVRNRFLWRERDLESAMTRELLAAVLDLCPRKPSALFFLAREVGPALLLEDLKIKRPVARVAGDTETLGLAADEVEERIEGPQSVQLIWVRGRPSEATDAHKLVQRLAARGLLLEPFERVLAGLREVYELGDDDGDSDS